VTGVGKVLQQSIPQGQRGLPVILALPDFNVRPAHFCSAK
jgi:hypothetical protein